MDRACYGRGGVLVTPQEFIRRASPRYKEKGIFPYCPACGEQVQLYGVHTPEGPSRFDHANRPEGANPFDDCIMADRSDSRFKGMHPRDFDFNHGRELRRKFFILDNIKSARQFIRELCGNINNLDDKFISLIQRANSKNIWSYTNIPLWTIPYILLTLDNFKHHSGFEFHFYFNKKKTTHIDELWEKEGSCSICKVFTDSGRPFKGSKISYPFAITEQNYKLVSRNPQFIPNDVLLKIRYLANQSY